jgi:hypothetical protein
MNIPPLTLFSPRTSRGGLLLVVVALLAMLAVTPALRAQQAPTSAAKPPVQSEKPPLVPEKTSPATAPDALGSEIVELSPFVVTGSQEVGYRATSTLAGTRLNTDLKDIGAAISVYTPEFLEDIGVTKLEEILSYTTSTEAAGKQGNYSGIAGENSAEVREDPAAVNRVRALAQATRTRDFFATDIPADTYSFDTLTISRGPNAILAGVGNAGGIIDSAMRKATFKDNYRVVSRFSSYDSHREELHFNKVIIPNRLALRLDLLNDRQNYRQEPAYNTDQRLYTALNYRMFEPKRGGFLGRGTMRANFEKGKIEGVPPDPLTPTFAVENWFNNLNPKWAWNGALGRLETIAGVPITGTSATNGIIRGFPLYTQWALIYADPKSNAAGVGFSQPSLANIQGFQGSIPTTLPGSPGGSVSSTGDPNRLRTGYVRNHLANPDVFNFYDKLITGVFDFREQDFDATDVRYEQLLLDGKAGIELAYNNQTFTSIRDFSIPTGGNDEGILIDVNSVLSIRSAEFPNGIPNPNFGRPFISTTDVFRDQLNRTTRESMQLTTFFKHDYTQSKSSVVRWFGRHTLSSLFFKTDIERFNRTYSSTWDPASSPSPQSSLNGAQAATFGTQVNGWFYLGPSLVNVPTIDDVRLESITSERPVPGQTYNLRVYDPVARTFVTGTSRPLRVLQRLVDQREELDSMAFALQSHWLKNHLVTVVGWREDQDQAYTSLTPGRLADGSIDESTKTFQPSAAQVKRSWTKSVVGRLPAKLPFDSELRAHWNQSGNFNPVGQRRNIWNEEIGSPTADTKEHGASISMFNGKFSLRVNRYTTTIQNDSVANVGNPYSYISGLIGRLIASRDAGLLPANFGYVYPGWNSFNDVALAVYDTLPERFRNNIGPDKNFNPRFTGTGNSLQWTPESIINLASTSNTQSTGTEYEAIINPVRGWRVSLSVAQTEAVKANVAVEELAFADEWKRNLDTMFDGKLLPGSRAPTAGTLLTFYSQYTAEALPSIRTASRLSGSKAPEIREWRANLVTRYEFQSGLLRGLGIGGAVRWQDRIGIGYPFIVENGLTVADINNPYWGPRDTAFDASLSYKRRFKIIGSTVNWSIFVNVININAKDELIPIRANPDGTWGTFRIPPDRTWSVSNTFSF